MRWILAPLLVAVSACAADSPPQSAPARIPAQLTLTAVPAVVLQSGGEARLTARLTDASGGNLVDVPVTFNASGGVLGATVARTDGSGMAATTITASEPVTISATDGALVATASITAVAPYSVEVLARPHPVNPLVADVSVVVAPAVGVPVPAPTVRVHCGTQAPVVVAQGTGAISGSCAFTSYGTHTITGSATAPSGWSASASAAVTLTPPVVVPGDPPSPVWLPLTGNLTSRADGRETWLFGLDYTPTNASGAVEYRWRFDDGTTAITSAPATSHTYTAGGAKRVTIEGYNRAGARISSGFYHLVVAL